MKATTRSDAECEGEAHAPAEGAHQAEQPHPGAPPAEAGGLQHLVVGRGGCAGCNGVEAAVLGGRRGRGLRPAWRGRRGGESLPHLVRHQPVVDALRGHQVVVAPALDHPAGVQHEDAVGVDHAGQPMRHDEDRAPAHEAPERVLDHRLVLRIDRRQRLVQQQDRRVPQQRAGDGDALALPAREADAALADHRRVALRQAGDEAVRVGRPRRRLDLGVARVRLAEADVLRRRAVEEIGVLIDHAEPGAEPRALQRAQVAAAEQDAASLRVVEAQQQAQDRGLAGAARADDADPLPRLDLEGEPVMGRPPAAGIGEMHVLEGERRREPARVRGTVRVADGGLGIEQAEQALGRGAPVHARVQQRPELAHGPENLDPHHQHDEQHLDPDGALGDAGGAQAERRRRAGRDAGVGDAARGGVAGQHPHRAAEEGVRLLGEEAPARAGLAEGLERRQPLHGIQQFGAVGRIGRLPRRRRFPVPVVERRRGHEGEQGEAEQDAGERQVEEGGEGEDAEGRHRGDEELRQILAEIGLQLLDPVDQGEQHVARALRAELAGADGGDAVVEARADLQLHQGGGAVRLHGAPVFEHAARDHRGGHGDDGQDQIVEAVAPENPPQKPAEQRQPRDPDRGRKQAEQRRARDAQPQALGELPQPAVEIHACRPSALPVAPAPIDHKGAPLSMTPPAGRGRDDGGCTAARCRVRMLRLLDHGGSPWPRGSPSGRSGSEAASTCTMWRRVKAGRSSSSPRGRSPARPTGTNWRRCRGRAA